MADDDQWIQARPEGVRWGLPEAIGVVALAGGILALAWSVPIPGLVFYAVVLLAIYLVIRLRGTGNPVRDIGLLMLPRDLLYGVVIAIAGRLTDTIAVNVARGITGTSPMSTNIDLPRDDVVLLVLTLVLATVVAPIAEEAMTRGLLLRAVMWAGLKRGHPAPAGTAILVSAVVFGALHVPQAIGDPALMVTLFVGTSLFGAVLGLFTVRTGRLGPAIAGHSFANALAILSTLSR